MAKYYSIFPIVELEIVPDQSLELIKGGGYVVVAPNIVTMTMKL